MNITRRKILMGLAAAPFAAGTWSAWSAEGEQKAEPNMTGTWHVTSAMNSVILSIEPDGQVLILLMEGSSFSMTRLKWRPLAGGVLVEGVLRFRLWAGQDPLWARVEMDLPEGLDVTESWREFPQAFFIRRIEPASLPAAVSERPLRDGWEKGVLDKEWDQKAGKRRVKIKVSDGPDAATNAAPHR
jgi:hypothetical protein